MAGRSRTRRLFRPARSSTAGIQAHRARLTVRVHDSSYPTLLPKPIATEQQLSRAVAVATATRPRCEGTPTRDDSKVPALCYPGRGEATQAEGGAAGGGSLVAAPCLRIAPVTTYPPVTPVTQDHSSAQRRGRRT